MISGKLVTAAAAAAVIVTGIASAWAGGAEDIKYRQTNYKAVGAHMGAMAAIVKGEVDHKDQLAVHAAAISAIADNAASLFPKGSGPEAGDTKALAVIWEDEAGFQEVLDGFKTAAANAAEVAKTGDMAAFGGALKQLGASCGACHKAYRGK